MTVFYFPFLKESEQELEDEVDILMSSDIMAAQMSTKSITFSRAQSGWLFREDKTVNTVISYLLHCFIIFIPKQIHVYQILTFRQLEIFCFKLICSYILGEGGRIWGWFLCSEWSDSGFQKKVYCDSLIFIK